MFVASFNPQNSTKMKWLSIIITFISVIFNRTKQLSDELLEPAFDILEGLRGAIASNTVKDFVAGTKNKTDDKIYAATLKALESAIVLILGVKVTKKNADTLLQDLADYLVGHPRAVQDAIIQKIASTALHSHVSDQGHEIEQHTADTITQAAFTHLKASTED